MVSSGVGAQDGHLHQQRVVGARDDRAGVGGAGIQPDTKPRRTAIGRDPPVVGNEVVFRILGCDPALQGMGIDPDVLLRGHAAVRRTDPRAAGDADLRLDDIDAGRALRDRVLDLDARIHLDEVEPAGVGVLQELDGARVEIVRGAPDREGRVRRTPCAARRSEIPPGARSTTF